MSLYAYQRCDALRRAGFGDDFDALLYALILKADGVNLAKIERCWPGTTTELIERQRHGGSTIEELVPQQEYVGILDEILAAFAGPQPPLGAAVPRETDAPAETTKVAVTARDYCARAKCGGMLAPGDPVHIDGDTVMHLSCWRAVTGC